jgi:formamidopyrimidine-DNA glycosylase
MKIITKKQFKETFNPSYDLLNEVYNLQSHLNHLEKKINTKKSICSIIMDQKYFPGVGNYIKSEGLYVSRIHPEEKWKNLNNNMKVHLIKNIKKVMNNSYKSGGAELKDFNNPFNSSKFKLKIYGKKYTKQNNLVTSKITSDARRTWFCPQKQKLI